MSASDVVPLRRSSDALVARLTLIAGAERTLDLQYYLWDSDPVGYLLLSRLLEAADRGVSVRLLVDDLKLRSRTRSIASLCLHPNLSVSVFNPWSERSSAAAQGVEFVRRFARLNLRMHNKLLVADGERCIVGGRNIAAEHFGLDEHFNLVDYDLLLTGSEVADLSSVFRRYWDSPLSVPGADLDDSVAEADLDALRSLVRDEVDEGRSVLATVLDEEGVWNEGEGRIALDADTVTVTFDTPGVSEDTRPTQVIEALREAVSGAERDLVAVTPFFVPGETDVEWYREIVDRGVRFRILTNSLASNQGTISNSGLSKKRLALLRAGVELHELRTDAARKDEWETPPQVARYLGLHAKLYVIDRERVFLGSVNLDPRSKFVNTEIGVLINNIPLAERTAEALTGLMTPENAWQVEIGSDGRLQWRSDSETSRRQPARNIGQRLTDTVYGLLPIGDYI